MLPTIRDDTRSVLNIHITPKIRKDGMIPTSLVVALQKIKGPTNLVDGGHQKRNRNPTQLTNTVLSGA